MILTISVQFANPQGLSPVARVRPWTGRDDRRGCVTDDTKKKRPPPTFGGVALGFTETEFPRFNLIKWTGSGQVGGRRPLARRSKRQRGPETDGPVSDGVSESELGYGKGNKSNGAE